MRDLKLMYSTICAEENEIIINDRLKYQKIFSIVAGTALVLFALTHLMIAGLFLSISNLYYYFFLFCGIAFLLTSLRLNVKSRFSKDEIKSVYFKKDIFRYEWAYLSLKDGSKRKTYSFPDEKEKLINFLDSNKIIIQN